jgi:hypothetical protein
VVGHTRVHSRPSDSARAIIHVDNEFTCHAAVAERHHACTVFEFRVGDETWCQPSMQGADVTHGVPHVLERRVDRYFAMNGCHG